MRCGFSGTGWTIWFASRSDCQRLGEKVVKRMLFCQPQVHYGWNQPRFSFRSHQDWTPSPRRRAEGVLALYLFWCATLNSANRLSWVSQRPRLRNDLSIAKFLPRWAELLGHLRFNGTRRQPWECHYTVLQLRIIETTWGCLRWKQFGCWSLRRLCSTGLRSLLLSWPWWPKWNQHAQMYLWPQ